MSTSQISPTDVVTDGRNRQRSLSTSSQLSLTLRSTQEKDVAEPATPFSEWPKVLSGKLVWSGTDAAGSGPYVVQLDADDIVEIENSVSLFKAQELHGDKVTKDTFPLSQKLSARLEAAADAVHNAQGYCQIKGLNPSKYSPEDNALIYLGIASYIGSVRGVQDSNGNMLSHVTVAKQWESIPERLRHGLHTTKSMPFHNDMGTDILGLHYRQCAKEGGFTHLSSGWKLYNELSAKHPDLLETLATPDWPIQITKRRTRHYLAPLVSFHDGKIMINLDPGRLGRQYANAEHSSAKANAGLSSSSLSRVPTLTQKQRDALDTFNRLAYEHKITIAAQPGDMIFVNNWALVHARDAYSDEEASGQQRRHAVRIWLHNPELAWARPAGMKAPWLAAFGYHFKQACPDEIAAAIPRTVVNRKYPIVPAADYCVPKYTAGSAAFILDSSDDDEDYLDDSSDWE